MDRPQPSRIITENMREPAIANRRRSPRYVLKTDIFLLFRANFERIGRLINVSSGGLAFEYSFFEKHENVVDVVHLEVDIFTNQPRQFVLPRVSCTVVYDISMEQPTFDGIETRLCGIKFEEVSQAHSELLKVLLSNYASHGLPGESVDSGSEISRRH